MPDLTEPMKDALRAIASSPGGALLRLAGGYWTTAEIAREDPLHAAFPHPPRWYATTPTVRALEARGLVEGISWQGPRRLTEPGRLAAADALLEQARLEKRDRLLAFAGRVTRENAHAMGMYRELDEEGLRLRASCEKCREEVTILVERGLVEGPPMDGACKDPHANGCIYCHQPVLEAADLQVLAEGLAHARCHRSANTCQTHGPLCPDDPLTKRRR